jgi:hypothetical protein
MSSLRPILFFLLCFLFVTAQSQQPQTSVSGYLDYFGQYYNEDDQIGAVVPEWDYSSNAFTYLNLARGEFKAGMRFESYLNPLAGYPVGFEGSGIGYRFVSWEKEGLEVTVGNFYEQFGSGMLLRSFEERTLGLDNALDGIRVRYRPFNGFKITGIVAKQRATFKDKLNNGNGVIRAIDGELSLNEAFKSLNESELRIDLGGSFVSKYNDDNKVDSLMLPKNVGAFSPRLGLNWKDWRFNAEYGYKINDPYPVTNPPGQEFIYNYKNGEAVYLDLGYSTKGFAIDLRARHVDNMVWRSTNNATIPTSQLIGFIAPPTKQYTYNLASTLYPYQSNLFGEVSYRADVLYKIPKDSKLGGKYGVNISASYTAAFAPERTPMSDFNETRVGYETRLFAASDSAFLKDFNIELKKKWSKNTTTTLAYYNWMFDDRAQLVAVHHERIYADIFVFELAQKLAKKQSIRIEVQGLFTEQDQGNWAFGMIEYTIAPHWSITVLDQYNYGNSETDKRFHNALANVAYFKGPHRFAVQYGRYSAGFFCVGGICRAVPASNGLSLSITSSF